MNILKFIKMLAVGLILAFFWLMIGMLFSQTTNLNVIVQSVIAFMWFFTYSMLIIESDIFK